MDIKVFILQTLFNWALKPIVLWRILDLITIWLEYCFIKYILVDVVIDTFLFLYDKGDFYGKFRKKGRA